MSAALLIQSLFGSSAMSCPSSYPFLHNKPMSQLFCILLSNRIWYQEQSNAKVHILSSFLWEVMLYRREIFCRCGLSHYRTCNWQSLPRNANDMGLSSETYSWQPNLQFDLLPAHGNILVDQRSNFVDYKCICWPQIILMLTQFKICPESLETSRSLESWSGKHLSGIIPVNGCIFVIDWRRWVGVAGLLKRQIHKPLTSVMFRVLQSLSLCSHFPKKHYLKWTACH